MASEAKSARLLVIYSRLASGDVLNKRELSQRFGTSERSVQRDMESLRCFFADQNLPQDIIYDRNHQGYRLVQKEEAAFTNSEILAVCKILLESRSMVREEMFPLLDTFFIPQGGEPRHERSIGGVGGTVEGPDGQTGNWRLPYF